MAQDKFTRMVMGARKADVDSIRELKDYIYEASGIANKSLRALEKAGVTEYAYGRAMEFLNTEYQSVKFPQAVAKRPVEDLIKQAFQVHSFLGSKTRTVSGAKAARKAQLEGLKLLQSMGYNVPTDKETLKRISKILGNSGVKFTQDARYEIMEALGNAIENNPDITDKELELNILRYSSTEITYNELLEEIYNVGNR